MNVFTKSMLIASLAILAGCATPEVSEQAAPEFSAENLHPVGKTGFEEAYVRPGADLPGFASVTFLDMSSADVVVTQTTVSGTTRGDWQMTPEKEARLAQIWGDASRRAFAEYPIAGSGELTVTAELKKVTPRRGSSTATTPSGGAVRGTSDVVEIAVEFRILDAASGDLLAVVRDRRTIASLQWGRAAGVDLVNLFNSWASLLHTRVTGR